MSRPLLVATCAVAGALALVACADTESLDAQEDTVGREPGAAVADDGVGTAEEAVGSGELPPVALPYQGHFRDVWQHLHARRFIVPHLASLHVLVHATWSDPVRCSANRHLKVSLHRENDLQVSDEVIYRTDGKTQGASWQNLSPGTYYLELGVDRPDEDCTLAGGVTLTL